MWMSGIAIGQRFFLRQQDVDRFFYLVEQGVGVRIINKLACHLRAALPHQNIFTRFADFLLFSSIRRSGFADGDPRRTSVA